MGYISSPSLERIDATHLEEVVAGHVGGELCHRLPPRSSDSKEQGVALRLPQNPAYARDVLDGVQEHDQRHRLLRLAVVIREVLVDRCLRLGRRRRTRHAVGRGRESKARDWSGSGEQDARLAPKERHSAEPRKRIRLPKMRDDTGLWDRLIKHTIPNSPRPRNGTSAQCLEDMKIHVYHHPDVSMVSIEARRPNDVSEAELHLPR